MSPRRLPGGKYSVLEPCCMEPTMQQPCASTTQLPFQIPIHHTICNSQTTRLFVEVHWRLLARTPSILTKFAQLLALDDRPKPQMTGRRSHVCPRSPRPLTSPSCRLPHEMQSLIQGQVERRCDKGFTGAQQTTETEGSDVPVAREGVAESVCLCGLLGP